MKSFTRFLQLSFISFCLCFLLFAPAAASQTTARSSEYYKSTVLNDYTSFDKLATIRIDSEFGQEALTNALADGRDTSLDSRYIIYTVVNSIKGNVEPAAYCAVYNPQINGRMKVKETYLVSLDDKNEHERNAELERYTEKEMSYGFDLVLKLNEDTTIDLPISLKNEETVTASELQEWVRHSHTKKYSSEKKYAVRVAKTTPIIPAGVVADLGAEKVFANDLLIMLDRPMVKHDFGDGAVNCVTVLYGAQEGLINASKLESKNGKVQKTALSSKTVLREVIKSTYVRTSASAKASSIGTVRKGALIPVTNQKGEYVAITTTRNQKGYIPLNRTK